MNNTKLYRSATILLLVINLVILVLIFSHRPSRPHASPAPEKILGLDATQEKAFDTLKKEHRDSIRYYSEQTSDAVEKYFAPLYTDSLSMDSAALQQILAIESQKLLLTYRHLAEVRQILTPEQMPQYAEFVRIISHGLQHGHKKPEHAPPH